MLIFFFKQKTAYDIRISDWSSDVCSSDLPLLTRKLTSYSLGLYGSRQYLEESGWTSGRESLAAHRIIGYIPDQIYAPELDYLAELQPGLEANLRSSSINAQHRLCNAGAGLALLPDFIGGQEIGKRT